MTTYTTDFNTFNGLIIFLLNDELFCTNTDNVFTIINPADYQQYFDNSFLLNNPLEIENLKISVIDLHSYFGLKTSKITTSSRFICLELNEQAFGFLTEKVEEIITLNAETKNEFIFIPSEDEKFLFGKVKYHDAVFNLPNFQKIINDLFVHH